MDVATRAWWTVDLGAVVNVKEVAISQRDKHGELRESLYYISDHVTVGNVGCSVGGNGKNLAPNGKTENNVYLKVLQ